MNGVSAHKNLYYIRLYYASDNLGQCIEFGMYHASGAGSIGRHVDLQSSSTDVYDMGDFIGNKH